MLDASRLTDDAISKVLTATAGNYEYSMIRSALLRLFPNNVGGEQSYLVYSDGEDSDAEVNLAEDNGFDTEPEYDVRPEEQDEFEECYAMMQEGKRRLRKFMADKSHGRPRRPYKYRIAPGKRRWENAKPVYFGDRRLRVDRRHATWRLSRPPSC